jgi:glycosyltransferase involved in cell wall biosynthesis
MGFPGVSTPGCGTGLPAVLLDRSLVRLLLQDSRVLGSNPRITFEKTVRTIQKPAKVAWISSVGEKGGAEVLMLNNCRALDRDRFRSATVLLRPGPLEAELQEVGVETFTLTRHRMRNAVAVARSIFQIAGLARRHSFDLINSNGFRAHFYGGLAARLAGIPEVNTCHAAELPGISTRCILGVPTRHVIANCPRTARYFESVGKPTTMVWPGVDVSVLRRGTPRNGLAAKYQLPDTSRWVCMSGRLQRFKGQIEFIRSIAALSSQPDLHGVIIGGSLFGREPAYQQELRALAAELGVSHRITFTGFIPDADVAGLIGASYVTMHPAHDEDFGISVAEAQGLGVPTIAFNAVGPAAIIEHLRTGWVVPVGDQSALNESLRIALADPGLVARMGKAAEERTARLFSLEEHVRKYQEVYSSVLGR